MLLEGFYTKLKWPVCLVSPCRIGKWFAGADSQQRFGGKGVRFYAGGKIVWRNKVQIQAGITVQRSLYDEPEEWSADKEHLTDAERYSDKILRTPNLYGYFTASYTPVKPFTIAFNGNYTRRMYVPHLMSEVNGTADVLVKESGSLNWESSWAMISGWRQPWPCNLTWVSRTCSIPIRMTSTKGQPVTRLHLRSGNSPHLLCGGKVQFLIFLYGRLFVISFIFLFKLSIQASCTRVLYVVVDCKRIDEILENYVKIKEKLIVNSV